MSKNNLQILGHTPEGRPIEYFYFGPPARNQGWILFIGGVHGDESEGVWLMDEVVKRLQSHNPSSIGIGILPQLNPDGVAKSQRCNSRGIDLNRNLPSRDWSAEITNPKYPPGPSPASEVENQILVKLITETPPKAILSAHSFHRYQVNINGPSEEWGNLLSSLCSYPVTQDIGYPTPGCLGTFSGKELGIPTITLEIERGLSKDKVIQVHLPLIQESIRYWLQKERS